MHCLGKRLILPELLDSLPREQARASLGDLVRINRRWGGHSTLRRLLAETVPAAGKFSVLDVGAASGDMGACMRQWYPGSAVTSLDYAESHLEGASGTRIAGDAFRLPFRRGSFDYVFCSLFLHHFTDEQVIALLKGFGEVARTAVLVIDLERNPIPYYFIAWSRPLLGWDPVTVHDGAISVEAAFHREELEELARRAGLRNPRARVYRPAFRIAMSAGV
ncbi:MAG TPA: methyltransferase domain-containing protein [Bryobacteraceae bacterium]|nr:methyltransferase domain-containing protein [Bryobacteraceae bacterium]